MYNLNEAGYYGNLIWKKNTIVWYRKLERECLEYSTPLNKYFAINKFKEYEEMSLESTKLRTKNRFKHDKCAINMCYLLWNLVAEIDR